MGKITSALKKAAEERIGRLDRIAKIKEHDELIVKKIGESKVDAAIVTYFDPKALVSEQYKILRTNLLSRNKTRTIKTIVVTSSIHSEGKTVTTLNLAFSLAQAMHKPKILVIDADLRKGKIHKYLGVDQRAGLSEILEGKASVDEAIFHIDYDNLAFISAGEVPEYPSELLASDNMRRLLSDMKLKFDYILFQNFLVR